MIGVIIRNLRASIFDMKTNVLQNFHIFISVPLKLNAFKLTCVLYIYIYGNIYLYNCILYIQLHTIVIMIIINNYIYTYALYIYIYIYMVFTTERFFEVAIES